jgi:hypothetical protein
MDPDRTWLPERAASPVVRGESSWYRPDNLLVDVELEDALPDLLAGYGVTAERYVGGRNDLWRERSGGPDYRDLNERLRQQELPAQLWVVTERRTELHQIVGELQGRGAGVHLNHVFVGEDWYHGGPDDTPTAVAGPKVPAVPVPLITDRAHLTVLDTAMPEDWRNLHGQLEAEIVHEYQVPAKFGSAVDENKDGVLDAQAGHGLFICGLARRVAPGIGQEVATVLHATGEGDEALISATLAETTTPVVNLSLGGYTDGDVEPVMLAGAVRKVTRRGGVVVAAAGNAGELSGLVGRPFWPAALPEVIAVGAYDSGSDAPTPARFSNRGAWVQVFAPGVELVSNYVAGWRDAQGAAFGGWASWSGTSFASPLVAAELARRVATAANGVTVAELVAALLADLPETGWPDVSGRLFVPKGRDDEPLDLTRWSSPQVTA